LSETAHERSSGLAHLQGTLPSVSPLTFFSGSFCFFFFNIIFFFSS